MAVTGAAPEGPTMGAGSCEPVINHASLNPLTCPVEASEPASYGVTIRDRTKVVETGLEPATS